MGKSRILGLIVIALAASYATGLRAFDLTGLWITDVSACDKVFSVQGGKASIRKDSDLFGSGFIVEGNRIRGRMASCTIKTRKEDGSILNLITACATDIMLSDVQFSVKVVDDNRITRIFPGIEGMELDYFRCPARPAAR